MARDISRLEIESSVPVGSDTEIVNARRQGRSLAEEMGFSATDATLVATVISELARNIVHYAGSGEGYNAMPGFADQLSPHDLEMLARWLTGEYHRAE